jgi:hypothetical protein
MAEAGERIAAPEEARGDPRDDSAVEHTAIHHFASGAGDQSLENIEIDRVLEETDRAVDERGVEDAGIGRTGAVERRPGLRVELPLVWLGPGHRLLPLDDRARGEFGPETELLLRVLAELHLMSAPQVRVRTCAC